MPYCHPGAVFIKLLKRSSYVVLWIRLLLKTTIYFSINPYLFKDRLLKRGFTVIFSTQVVQNFKLVDISVWVSKCLAQLSQSNMGQDRAQTQSVILRCWPLFYCYCTSILSAIETFHVSLEDKSLVQWH